MQGEQLISPQQLRQYLDRDDWHIVDCRFSLLDTTAGRREYCASHIPGAVFLDLNQDLASAPTATIGRHPLPEVENIAATIGGLGIDSDSQVIVYDHGNGAMAARGWWIFRWLGHDRVRLLDGGWSAWKDLGLPLSAEKSVSRSSKFSANVRNEMVITTQEIAASAGTGDMPVLLDARDAARFEGLEEPIDAIAGHVPGARNLPFPESLREDGRWKSAEELQAMWRCHLDVTKPGDWVVMCGSGVTACHLVLSAVEAGYSEPRLYVGSWSEWIRDSRRPIARGLG